MKTYSRLIDTSMSDEAMDESLKTAIQNKTNRPAVQEVIESKEKIKIILRDKILNRKLNPIVHEAHEINDGFKQKKRIIIQPYFTKNNPEQWLQHIVIHTLKPIFMKGMYEFSCGSVPGRGIHYGKKYLEKFIKNHPKQIKYALKLDIRHFYENVDINLLKERFRSIIKDDIFLYLIFWVLDSNIAILPTEEKYKTDSLLDFIQANGSQIGFCNRSTITSKNNFGLLFICDIWTTSLSLEVVKDNFIGILRKFKNIYRESV